MAARGCGASRTAGQVYIECPLSPVGMPIEHFITDAPAMVEAEAIGLSAVGVKIIERNGVAHVWDIVGQEHYPNVADFVEEVKRLGLSRKIAVTSDFAKLTEQSRIVLLHARAFDHNFQKYPADQLPPCPKTACMCGSCQEVAHKHTPPHGAKRLSYMCASTWWHNLEGDLEKDGDKFVRTMPSFKYTGMPRPESIAKPNYSLAIFMTLPIGNLAIIRDPEANKHVEAANKASKAKLPVKIVEE